MERERSSLAPLVVALLLAAFLVVGTGVGGLVAWRLFAPVKHIQPGYVLIEDKEEVFTLVEEGNGPPGEPKPGN